MPGKNIVKTYLENSYYHLYNRGVDKRALFQNEHDYHTFLYYLKLYLAPPESLQFGAQVGPVQEAPVQARRIKINLEQVNLHHQIKLLAYCLMPNHFHLLVYQKTRAAITQFMRRLSTAYSMTFNKRYQRTGGLFESNYRAVLVETEEQLIYLSKYIHRNPIKLTPVPSQPPERFLSYPYSSLHQYLGSHSINWLYPKKILELFGRHNPKSSYNAFVREKETEKEMSLLGSLALER